MGMLDSLLTNYGGGGAQFPAAPMTAEEAARQAAGGDAIDPFRKIRTGRRRQDGPEDGRAIAGMLSALPLNVPTASPWGQAAQAAGAPGGEQGASGVDESGFIP